MRACGPEQPSQRLWLGIQPSHCWKDSIQRWPRKENTCGKDHPTGRVFSFLGFQGGREAFGYDQNYSPLAGQALLCVSSVTVQGQGRADRWQPAQGTLESHPGSSLLKNLKKRRASINTSLDEKVMFRVSASFAERWAKVRVA